MGPKINAAESTSHRPPDRGLVLYSLQICPFVQRIAIALHEKGVPFDVVHIDVRDKPAWFMTINPDGKLPAMIDDGKVLYESGPLLEYVEERFPDPPLFPRDLHQRWRARLWLQTINAELIPAFYRLLLQSDEQTIDQRRDDLAAILGQLLDGIDDTGPYFLGPELSAVDATLYPFIERMCAQTELRGFVVPAHGALDRWVAAVEARPAVQRTRLDRDTILDVYRQYVDGSYGRTYFEANPGGDGTT